MSNVRRSRLPAATAAVVALTGGLVAGATSQASAASCATNSYTRQFFANTSFSGAAKRTDCDASIGENWGNSSPGVSGVGIDNFGVRWQVTRDFGSGGPFAFNASGQDGIRVYLDGVRKIDLWKNGSTTVSKTINLTIPKGTHTLRIDYVNWNGAAAVKFTYTPRAGAGLDPVTPLAPSGLAIARDAASKRNVLRWSANKEMDVAGYRVYRRAPDQASFDSPIATVTGTTFTDTTAGTVDHVYEVRAFDKSGNASPGTTDVSVTGNPTFLRQYFANTTFTGTPSRTDTDASIGENWGNNSPGVSGVGIDNFGVRWQVTRDFGSGGPFAFNASGQDGIRVYLDGVRKIDLWKNGSTTVSKTATLTMPPGTHVLRVDYVNWNGAAAVNFSYGPAASGPDRVAPLPPARTKVVYDEGAGTATLTWAPSREMDLPAYPYQVYRQIGDSGWISMGPSNKTAWTDPLKISHDGIPRQYAVRATDRVGNQSQLSPTLTITPQDTITPSAPDLEVAHKSGTSTSLILSWFGPAATVEEVRTGGSLRIYRSTGQTLGDTPKLIATVTAASATTDSFTDELPAYDGTSYTYAAQVTDAAGNVSPMSKPVTVTPDSVPPPALTGLTATPRADGIVLSWDAPAESDLHYVAARVVRRADGSIHYDNSGCFDAADWAAPPRDVPNALLCAGPPDGETVTFFVAALDPWDNHIPWAAASTVTITEPDNRPAEARNADTGPLTITSSENAGNLGTVQWRCDDEALCSNIAEYHVDAWNPSTNTYNRIKTIAGSKGPIYASYVPLNRADTTYFRITGVRPDGTTAAITHGAQSYGYSL
ncbi:PA14 domain-containing protein [Streptomyces sp. NPDC059668]|uniref:PA14 domain-containing protein n=1 Tax=Streptomyces sp. NPDC059668 TaxID=3346900 RepID=UPI00369F6653